MREDKEKFYRPEKFSKDIEGEADKVLRRLKFIAGENFLAKRVEVNTGTFGNVSLN
jgi:hypothetical protein